MIQIDSKSLKQIWDIQVELLLEVDRICEKCQIRYHISDGTLIGAVRHHGHIPWDDDADVSMLREEYEKFREACKKELDQTKYYFQEQGLTEGYRWGYGKIRKKGTVFIKPGQEHLPYEQGICIDIFPIDGVPDGYISYVLHDFKCFCYRKIFWSEVGKTVEKNPFIRIAYRLLALIPFDVVCKSFQKFIEKSNQRAGQRVRLLVYQQPRGGRGNKREWYLYSSEYQFDGHVLKGIAEYDEYLNYIYGNYKELPPIEERTVHPAAQLELGAAGPD